MLRPVEPLLFRDLTLQRLSQFVLLWAEDGDGRLAVPERQPCKPQARIAGAVRIGAGVSEDQDRRLQALGAMHGHHPHRIRRRGRVADDLHLAAGEPVEKGLQRRGSIAFEVERRGQ